MPTVLQTELTAAATPADIPLSLCRLKLAVQQRVSTITASAFVQVYSIIKSS